MVVVKLYGVLESVAQRTTQLRVKTFDEAIRALFANFPKLRGLMRDMRINIMVNGRALTFEDCLRPFRTDRIDITPIIGGTGPAVFIVAGALMAYGASAVATMAFMELGASLAVTAMIQTFVANMGMALLVGGVSQILMKNSLNTSTTERAADTPSYMFNGAINTMNQGNPVPVGFGRMRVGSQVIAVNLQTFDIPLTASEIAASTPAAPEPPPVIDSGYPYNEPGYGGS